MLRYVAYLILAEEMDLHFPFLRKFSYTNIFGINRMSTLHALTVEVCIETEISLGPTKCQSWADLLPCRQQWVVRYESCRTKKVHFR